MHTHELLVPIPHWLATLVLRERIWVVPAAKADDDSDSLPSLDGHKHLRRSALMTWLVLLRPQNISDENNENQTDAS